MYLSFWERRTRCVYKNREYFLHFQLHFIKKVISIEMKDATKFHCKISAIYVKITTRCLLLYTSKREYINYTIKTYYKVYINTININCYINKK